MKAAGSRLLVVGASLCTSPFLSNAFHCQRPSRPQRRLRRTIHFSRQSSATNDNDSHHDEDQMVLEDLMDDEDVVWSEPHRIRTTYSTPLSQQSWLDGGEDDSQNFNSHTNGASSLTQNTETNRLAVLLALAASIFALSSGMQWMLHQYEWFQAYRYVWPLIGLLYAADSVNTILSLTEQESWGRLSISRIFLPIVSGVAGIGLVVGGCFDAFMPVWMTGPNVFTAAGIGQDSAFILWILTAASVMRSEVVGPEKPAIMPSLSLEQSFDKDYGSNGDDTTAGGLLRVLLPPLLDSMPLAQTSGFWAAAILLSQLYILSDAAFEDVLDMISNIAQL